MKFWLQQFFSDRSAHRSAVEEVFFVCVISLLPLFALAIIDQFRLASVQVSELFWDAIATGQLYLYSFSLLGTLFWLCQKEHENFDRFQPRRYLMFAIFVPSILIILIYALDPSMSKPLKPELAKASFYIYLLYVVLYYVLLVFDNLEPPPIELHLQQKSNELMTEYKQTTEHNALRSESLYFLSSSR
jgi:hypothetical protein